MIRNFKAKICTVCGEVFIPNSSKQKYCSKCKIVIKRERDKQWMNQHYIKRQKRILICERCDELFVAKSSSQKYCEKCSFIVNLNRNRRYDKKRYERHNEWHKQWKEGNHERWLELQKANIAKRKRNLGFEPLNEYFEGAEAHHINKEEIIYIPRELHKSTSHRQGDWDSMLAMNKLAFQYLIDNG